MSIYDNSVTMEFFIFYTFLAAMGLGSFLNCVAFRVARKEGFVKGSSRCPHCDHELKFFDLIPIFSYIFLRGKCRYCKKKISPRYLISELVFMGLLYINLFACDITYLALRNDLLICCLFVITLVDYDSYIIPDSCIIAASVIWLAFTPVCGGSGRWEALKIKITDEGSVKEILLYLLTGLLVGAAILGISLIMDHILGVNTMGGGDIKLFAVMGLYLGALKSLFAVFAACILGLVFGIIFNKLNSKNEEKEKDPKITKKSFPFGPAIAVAFYIMLYCGDFLRNAYLGMIGVNIR